MMKRKRGPVSEMTLVPVDLRRQRQQRLRRIMLAIIIIPLVFAAGYFSAGNGGWGAGIEQQRLRMKVSSLETSLREARDELALHRTSSEVSFQAQEQVRQELRGLRDQIAELEEAVAFYKNVMAPGDGEQGLRIERFDLAPTEDEGVYHYRLVLTQVGDNRDFIAGSITLTLEGQRAGERVSIPAAELVRTDASNTRFRFRYLQELSGSVEVPADIQPGNIKVEAAATGRGGQRVERQFGWQLQERDSARAG